MEKFKLSPNPLVQFLDKSPEDFTQEDLIRYIVFNHIQMINLRYTRGDGRLKTLNFVVTDLEQLSSILTYGERVDGSSLFPYYIEAGASDLYVIPRYRTAFLDPFSEIPTLNLLCSFYDKSGIPLASSPEYTLRKAARAFREVTGMEFQAMGELEYYVISPADPLFEAADQKGYHESAPFGKWGELRVEAMRAIAQTGGEIKYGHAEVGTFTQDGFLYEQNEIEFLPVAVERAADQLVIAKWILRTLARKHGVEITFAPKITTGKAGSGMHVHTRVVKDQKNQYVTSDGLSDTALKVIGGMLDLAGAMTAFGNTNPTSYFRLVPHQEAPTNICWGDRNRSVLVRVPLGWSKGACGMIQDANPREPSHSADLTHKQTIEFRCPDGSADIYLLLAALCVAARYGFEMEHGVQYAQDRYVSVNIFDPANSETLARLNTLPDSCAASADALRSKRAVFERYDVFDTHLIDGTIRMLEGYNDRNIRNEIGADPDKLAQLVRRYFHAG